MRSATAKQTEKAAYDLARETSFTRILGRPSRMDRNNLRREVCGTASEVDMPFEECGDYGLLGEIMEADEYTDLTGLTYADIDEPSSYDPDITDDMEDHERREREAEWKEVVEAWHSRKGALRGICDNIRDALDPK